MNKALKKWRSPNPFKASFRALLEIILIKGNGDVAIKVADYLASLNF